jgi:hypothetical protein
VGGGEELLIETSVRVTWVRSHLPLKCTEIENSPSEN